MAQTVPGSVLADIAPVEPGTRLPLSWIPDGEVPKAHRQHVERHVRRLERRYGLAPIRVRYFGPARRNRLPYEDGDHFILYGDFYYVPKEPDRVPLGVTPEDDSETIGIHHGLRGAATAYIVAHEVRHVMAHRRGEQVDERECDRFATRYVRRLGLV